MHIIFLIVLVLFVVYYLYRNAVSSGIYLKNAVKTEANDDISATLEPVYLSDGKLFSYSGTRERIHIESSHIENMNAREERNNKQSAWKKGTTWDTSFTQMRGMGERHEESNIQFASVTRLAANKLLYSLKGAGFGGLFEYCLDQQKEQRLSHSQNLDYRDLSKPDALGQILLCAVQGDGNSNIAMIEPQTNAYQQLTGGDTIDSAPSWVTNQPNKMVYQSQGLARAGDGYIKGVGPSELILFDTKSGELETIFTDQDTDYLRPNVSQQGSLYFIKRPFEDTSYSQSNAILDALYFPFRLLRAVFHYLNFFSLMYSRKPLTSAGGPKATRDIKDVVLQGRRIDAEKALRQHSKINGVPSLVPANWVLVRCDKNGNQEELANHVASYSIGEDDNIIYSNGCAIFYISPAGEHKKVLQEKIIDDISI